MDVVILVARLAIIEVRIYLKERKVINVFSKNILHFYIRKLSYLPHFSFFFRLHMKHVDSTFFPMHNDRKMIILCNKNSK